MNVRHAFITDATRLAEIYCKALEVTFKEAAVDTHPPLLAAARSNLLTENIATISRSILVIENDDGLIAGFVSFGSLLETLAPGYVTGEVYMLYVHPDFWRQGVGEALIDMAIEELEDHGHNSILLWIVEGASGAENFYLARGWQKTDITRPDFEGAPIVRRCMLKRLAPVQSKKFTLKAR